MNNNFLIASALCMSMSATVNAQNPIVQTQLTTDPAPLVVGDRLYVYTCLLYTSPSPRDLSTSRMPSSA